MNKMLQCLPFNWIQEIVNLAAEWIVVVDRDGKVLYMNESYCKFVDRDPDEVIGMDVQDVIENSRMHFVAKNRAG
ncbi:PAS domain-containing protein [Gottfriedia sp. OAE603]|uniref:PAS domain-containing protein n=1 Tax=Gottfriedia sp. OAE603 TaxID=2663872 RepID=UPI0034983E5D